MPVLEQPPTTHPIVGFGVRVHEVLDDLGETPAWSMTTDEQRAALVELARAEARIAALRLRVLAAADRADVAADSAASSTAAWVAHATRQTRPAAHRDMKLATALDDEFAATREALAGGRLDLEQARVIVAAVQALPTSVDSVDRQRAEKHLVHEAGDHDAAALKVLGKHVHEVLDPEAADAALGAKLAEEEANAARSTYLHLRDNGDGTHTGRFKISSMQAAMLRKALEAFTNPRHRHSDKAQSDQRPRMPRPERLGQAFGDLIERFPAHRLPESGGLNATVVVLLDFDKLLSGIGTAVLDTGERISAGLARRMACEAGIVPAVYRRVLGGASVVLDLGRKTRLHTKAQRVALTIRDGGCTAEGCDRPAAWCHAHHDIPWVDGGDTSVANGRLLCPFHHGRAHSPAYDVQHLPDGKIAFHRRT
jgi:hypothetical protein